MKKWLISLVLVPLMFVNIQSVFADESLKIGVVDLQQVLMQSPQVQTINSRLQQEFEPREQEVRDMDESTQQDQLRLSRDEAVMSQAEIAQIQSRIQRTRRDLQRKQEDLQQDINIRQNQEMSQLVEQIRTVILNIAANQSFDLVLQKDTLPYASDKFDITQQVIAQLSEDRNNG